MNTSLSKQTAFYKNHRHLNAKMVDFTGWNMPLHYGSQIEEHHAVRNDAGMFDVSHMTIIDITGKTSRAYLEYLLANDVNKLMMGQALYTPMLNKDGGVIDDLIVYKMSHDEYRMIVNASTREKVLAWMKEQAIDFSVLIKEKTKYAMIAIQGPNAFIRLQSALSLKQQELLTELGFFYSFECEHYFIAQTGYTGEKGYEVILPIDKAPSFWNRLIAAGIQPCGLAARDTLRLEAGFNLYGNEMDESISPLEANMAWTIDFKSKERYFIGRSALENQKEKGLCYKLVGLVLEGKGILRSNMKIIDSSNDLVSEGVVTSGTLSPTLQKSIALARVPKAMMGRVDVIIRGKNIPAMITAPCFIKNGKSLL
jgi:aminomethyltransferase